MSVGTRGDMEPFLAIGEILKAKGHQVICAFPEQFRNIVEESNMEFSSLGSEFIDMLDSEDGKAALGGEGSGFKKMRAYIKLASKSTEINKSLLSRQYELIENVIPDRIVHNGKAMYPIIWAVKNSGKTIFISPLPYMHFVKDHTHVAFNSNYGPFLNKLTYSLANLGTITTLMISIKWLKIKEKMTRKQVKHAYYSNKAIYTISPSVFKRPDYWDDNIQVLGYHDRTKINNWQPEKELFDFIEKHDKILFITFGSMSNPKPEEKTKIILEILNRNKIPAIINTASGGLVKPDKFNSELVYFVSQIPYDWIFPKVHAVIHHGGSGTFHLALRYGCPTMIIPHIIDQFVWDKIVYKMGVGPKGIRIDKINNKTLESKVIDLLNNTSFKENAEMLASQMKNEDLKDELYYAIVK